MPTLTAVYVDFLSPDSYRVWRWLSALPERETVQIRPFLADEVDPADTDPEDAPGTRPWDRRAPSRGLELLAMGELARDAGPVSHRAFVETAFAAVHRDGLDLGRAEAWLMLATEAQLDLEAFARDGERWRAEVGLWHAEAQDDLGVTDVPTLVFDDEIAVLVRLGEPVEQPGPAARLLAALTALVELPVAEVRATTG